jgi:hypothetical protein
MRGLPILFIHFIFGFQKLEYFDALCFSQHAWTISPNETLMTSVGNARLPYEIREFSQAYGGGRATLQFYILALYASSKRKHAIITAYWPSVRSVLWNIRTTFFSMDRATKERGPCKKTDVWYFAVQTEQARSIIGLLYGWT